MIPLSCGQTVPRWYPIGLYRPAFDERVRTPHPENISSDMSRSATRAALPSSTMPVHRACPGFDDTTAACRPPFCNAST